MRSIVLFAFALLGLSQAVPPVGIRDSSKLTVSDSAASSVAGENRQVRGIAFPSDTSNLRSPAYVANPGSADASDIESRHEYIPLSTGGDDRQLGSILNSLGDMSFDLGMRMPVYKFHLNKIAKYFIPETAPGTTTSSSLLKLNMGSVAVLGGLVLMAAMYFPGIFSRLGLVPSSTSYRNNGGDVTSEDILDNVNNILARYNIDTDACLKMAMCSIGRSTLQKPEGRNAGTSPLDILDTVLNFGPVKNNIIKKSYRQAREFGLNGGDCEQFNKDKKCPITANAFRTMLSGLL